MTKINTYLTKNPVSSDKFVGSDSENNNRTVNFTFEGVLALLNSLNESEVVSYVFSAESSGELDENGTGYFISENDIIDPEDLTKIIVSKNITSGIDLSQLFTYIGANKDNFVLKLRNISDPNNFIYLDITSVTEEEFSFSFSVSVNETGGFLGELADTKIYSFLFEVISLVDSEVVHKIGDTFIESLGFPPLLSYNTDTSIGKRFLEPESTRLDVNSTSVFSWGDSLTAGDGFISSYPYQLNLLSGFAITNRGVPGETSTQIKNRLVADTGNYSKSVIIWAGRNNYSDPTTVKADIATMISTIGHTRYLVVGIVNGDYATEYVNQTGWTQINQLNADLKALYGNKFVDIRPYLVSLHTNSAQDLIDFANDVPPTSLRIDLLHYNTAGYIKISEFLNQRLGFLYNATGYFQSKDFKPYFEAYFPMHTVGNETFTGLKSTTNSGSLTGAVNGLDFTNTATHVNSYSLGLYNTNVGSASYGLNSGAGSVNYYENTGSTGSASKYFNSGNSAISITNATGATQGILINTITGIRGVSVTNTGNSQSYFTNLTSNGTGFSANVQSGFGYLATVNTTGTGLQFDNVAGGTLVRLNSQTASTGNILEIRKNNTNVVVYNSNGVRLVVNSPTTSAGGYEIYTRNTTTGLEEKVPSSTFAPTLSPVLTGIPTAPTATVGTSTTQIATTAFVQAEKKLVFRGLISQSGTSDPTLIVLENNTGLTMAVSRTGTGQYLIQPTVGSFDYSKTYYHLENNIDNDSNSIVLRMRQNDALGATTGGLKIISTSTSSGVTTYFDSQLVKTPIEIIVYP